ncbi:hypothetical protein SRB17_20120 [Streptomyces sp. RB17]|uniref:DUF1254 domain-containing protein n=1 Tax=Streptomyces sp. RB17 TaxID=2585197 RepID=UPI001297A4C1|nr:DUF1254 domain-containing protein [Streptomyces sp. RB17]MQY34046.1 hypothetical protein [Streptomyces sp. RB17]
MTDVQNETATELADLAAETYVFAYPLVLMELTKRQMTSKYAPEVGHAPINTFAHAPAFPDAAFESVVSPNVDTLYSVAWLDLSAGPVQLSVPDTDGRYYMLELLDAWTNVFACPGTRTTGNEAAEFALVGPGWQGELPDGVQRIDAPTATVWCIGRTYTDTVADYPAVHAVQAGYRLTPLGGSTSAAEPGPGPVDAVTAPVDQVATLDAATFFAMTAHLLATNPERAADAPMTEALERLGVIAGRPFDWDALTPDEQKQIARGAADGLKRVEERGRWPRADFHDGWLTAYDLGEYGTDYLHRASIAWVGLGANLPQDALYPLCRVDAGREPLHGGTSYTLHFEADALPPADAFWSLTMYNDRQFFVDNPLNRYAIGDRDALEFNPDGSLTLLIQHASPGEGREANWLPAPEGSFNVIMRLYLPRPEALDGSWRMPGIRKAG